MSCLSDVCCCTHTCFILFGKNNVTDGLVNKKESRERGEGTRKGEVDREERKGVVLVIIF